MDLQQVTGTLKNHDNAKLVVQSNDKKGKKVETTFSVNEMNIVTLQ